MGDEADGGLSKGALRRELKGIFVHATFSYNLNVSEPEMSMPPVREFKIAGPKGDGRHAYLNENGVFIGRGTPLLEKDADGRWRPRQRQLLESLLTKGYGGEVDLESRMSGFT